MSTDDRILYGRRLTAAQQRIAELEAERDGWATAGVRIEGMLRKAEAERDAARAALAELDAEFALEHAAAVGWYHDNGEARRALQATREALEAIDKAECPVGAGCHHAGEELLRGFARRALKAMGTPGEATKCPACHWTLTESHANDCEFIAWAKARKAAAPAAPLCKPWCGTLNWTVVRADIYLADEQPRFGFCTEACLFAGRPLHPTTPTPTEETPR